MQFECVTSESVNPFEEEDEWLTSTTRMNSSAIASRILQKDDDPLG